MSVTERERLAPSTFRLPVEKIRDGYYSDAYFNHTKALMEADGHHPHVVMQVFQREDSILGGVDEAIAVLKQGAGRRGPDGRWVDGFGELDVRALHEGDALSPWETVMTIEGDYSLFAHLETVYLGCMARRTLVMRNVRRVVEAAQGKPILFFPARHDHWLVQTGDGWAAHVAGAIGVSTDAQASWWGGRGIGTVPHGLIAAYGGDTVRASRLFAARFAREMNVTVLVDFRNDSVTTALEVADALGSDLWGVRLDTSDKLADEALQRLHGDAAPKGVAPELVQLTRDAARRARPSRRQDRRLGRLHRRSHPRVRAGRRARGRLRRRLEPAARRQRLHGRRGRGRRQAGRRRSGASCAPTTASAPSARTRAARSARARAASCAADRPPRAATRGTGRRAPRPARRAGRRAPAGPQARAGRAGAPPRRR